MPLELVAEALPASDGPTELSAATFRRIATLVKAEAGLLLPDNKISLVRSRLTRRLRSLELASFEDYCTHIESEAGRSEHGDLINALTTNVTSFFREQHHFDDLAENVLPALIERGRKGERIRLWSAGCSIGAEPYSLAMLLLKHWPDAASFDVRILATDIDATALEKARAGSYDAEMVEKEVPSDFRRFFVRAGTDNLRVADSVKGLVTVKQLNFAKPWPVRGPFQVVFCRNVVIYFDQSLTDAIYDNFARIIEPGARLYLGHSERMSGQHAARFEPVGVTAYKYLGPAG